MTKLKNILFKENSGDFSGAGTFQGGAYGFGNRYQLANSQIWPGLLDPEEDLPGNPSFWPALRAQRDSDRNDYDSLESSEVYDDRPHLGPIEDSEREELLDPENDIDPSYFYMVNERGPSDVNYRDLPGFPKANTLSHPVSHVPEDEDPDQEESDTEEERYNVPRLLPSPRENVRGEPFGLGSYDDQDNLTLNRNKSDTNITDPMNDQIFNPMDDFESGNELRLNKKRNKSLKSWKTTTPENMGHTNRDAVFNHLVNPVNWIEKEFGQDDYKKELDEEDDVPTRAGSMGGNLANKVKHVPGPVDNYSYSSGYLREYKDKKMSETKKSKKSLKRKIVKYLPDDLDKKVIEKPYGKNFGTIVKKYEFSPEAHELKDIEPVETEVDYIPYATSYPEKFTIIVQTKLFDKLKKLIKEKK